MVSSRRLIKKQSKKWEQRQRGKSVTDAMGDTVSSLAKESDLFCTKKMPHPTGIIRIPTGKTSVNWSCSRGGDVASILSLCAPATNLIQVLFIIENDMCEVTNTLKALKQILHSFSPTAPNITWQLWQWRTSILTGNFNNLLNINPTVQVNY